MATHSLQSARQAFLPTLPQLLNNLSQVSFSQVALKAKGDEKIKHLFPQTFSYPFLQGEKRKRQPSKSLKIGVVFSGGQAAGGHNVITGLFDCLKHLNSTSHLFGFLNGPNGIIKGEFRELSAESIAPFRNQGGFDLIGSGRTKIETSEQLTAALAVIKKMQLDGLVVIGGDDSNTNAAVLAEFFLKNGCETKVIGVPKTIDGDLKNAEVAISFGFDTACKTYSEMIGNIARDAASAKKYYHFIKLMGRSASHIALECALQTHPNLTLIGEEIAAHAMTLSQVTSLMADLICKRAERGKEYGVILIPEGLIEFIPEVGALIKELNQILAKNPSLIPSEISLQLSSPSQSCYLTLPEKIQQQLLLHRDPHGNVQVSQIETERLLIETVSKKLDERQKKGLFKGKFSALPHFLGYEGRAAFPSNFDCNYCYALGFTAALLIDEGVTGYMAFISELTRPAQEWGIGGVPLTSLLHLEVRKGQEKPVIQKALVDLKGVPFIFFQKHREQWMFEDTFLSPGPIQFFGDSALTDCVPVTLTLEAADS